MPVTCPVASSDAPSTKSATAQLRPRFPGAAGSAFGVDGGASDVDGGASDVDGGAWAVGGEAPPRAHAAAATMRSDAVNQSGVASRKPAIPGE